MTPVLGLPLPPMFASNGGFTSAWGGWFSSSQKVLQATSMSGPTSARPLTNLYVGQFYMDTTLGFPVWLLTAGASPVWVNSSGTPS